MERQRQEVARHAEEVARHKAELAKHNEVGRNRAPALHDPMFLFWRTEDGKIVL